MGTRIGYAVGAFDLFHVGHLNLLRHAKQHCDILIAGVVSDEMLRQVKGIEPVIPTAERAEIVKHISFVDDVYVETTPSKMDSWRDVQFTHFFKGDDWRGTMIMAEYRQAGVATDFLRVVPEHTSSIATILVRQADGDRAIVYCPGSTPELTPADVPAEAICSAKILHINGRYLDACHHACRIARDAGVRVSFDGGAQRYRPEIRPLVAQTDICIVAFDFARQFTGETSIKAAAHALLAAGPALVVITDGVRGSWIYPREAKPFHQPAFPQADIVDTTGCGDTYHGAFLFGLSRQMSLPESAELASKTAAHNARFLGGRGGLASALSAINPSVQR